MAKILFIGENPYLQSGNGHMMRAILEQLDGSKHSAVCFATGESLGPDALAPHNFGLINANEEGDYLGRNKLLRLLGAYKFDAIVMIGIDLWTYSAIFDHINRIRQQSKFVWVAIFPYDLIDIRPDWLNWMRMVDVPCVYSKDGYDRLRNHIETVQYFRPPLYDADKFYSYNDQQRSLVRERYFRGISNIHERFIFGFMGQNQIRKDPQKVIKAFAVLKRSHPDALLYLHTELKHGVYNLEQYARDQGLKTYDITAKEPGKRLSTEQMVDLYNALDCTVNCSYQEGLSWTVLESLLCGVPVVLSETTAHKDFINMHLCPVFPVGCQEPAYIPVATEDGQSYVDTYGCRTADLKRVMDIALHNLQPADGLGSMLRENGRNAGEKWLAGCSDINKLLDEVVCGQKNVQTITSKEKRNAVLFAQHSSAGDVLMTTKALKGLRDRHPGLPLIYMTQRKYWDIVLGNPNIDEVVEWDEKAMADYQFVYAPHRDIILPGHWGRNSNSLLSDFYWKILDVPRGEFFIQKVKPNVQIVESIDYFKSIFSSICIVHTTGGNPEFRTYKYMDEVCNKIVPFTIQVGGADDFEAGANLDLRGKLSYRETAWVMSQANCAVTVDSFISHLAGALGISQVCLFGSGNANVVKPDQVAGELICLIPDYIRDCPGLGPCSASVRDCPTPCTGMHDPRLIIAAIEAIESKRMQIQKEVLQNG